MKKKLFIAAALLSAAMTLHAGQISGGIDFIGGVNLDTVSAGSATKVTAWYGFGGIGNPKVTDASGDFALFVRPGVTTATFAAPWSFNSGPVPAFWSAGGFTFDLTASVINSQGGGGVTVNGIGVISGNGYDPTPGIWSFSSQDPSANGRFSFSASVDAVPSRPLRAGDTATIGFWQNKNGQGMIKNAIPCGGSPSLANWLAVNFPCLYGTLAGKANSDVAALFILDFNVTGQKTYAQILGVALACYFTDSDLNCNTPLTIKFGFNLSSAGTGGHTYNVGSDGAAIGLVNNTSYPIFLLLQQANMLACQPGGFSSSQFNALNNIFDGINSGGDI